MEYFITSDGKYRIESLTPATIPGALRVIKEALFKDESAAIDNKVDTTPEAIEELLELCADAALDGCSLVAVVISTGEVAAAIFNKIKFAPSHPSEKTFYEIFLAERCTQATSRSTVQYMIDIDTRCNLFEIYNIDCSFELMFLATLREYRRQNLATLLWKYSIDVARKVKDGAIVPISVADLGPKYSHLKKETPIDTYPKICQAVCIGKGSQTIAKNYNFTVHLTIPDSEHLFNDETDSEQFGVGDGFSEVLALAL